MSDRLVEESFRDLQAVDSKQGSYNGANLQVRACSVMFVRSAEATLRLIAPQPRNGQAESRHGAVRSPSRAMGEGVSIR